MGYKHCKEGHILDRSWKYCPVCLAPLRGWLVAMEDNRFVKFYTIHEGKSFIGSGVDCEIRIQDAALSRQHAYLILVDDMCTIVDLGNGEPLQVNKRTVSKVSLLDGDIILLGSKLFKITLL